MMQRLRDYSQSLGVAVILVVAIAVTQANGKVFCFSSKVLVYLGRVDRPWIQSVNIGPRPVDYAKWMSCGAE